MARIQILELPTEHHGDDMTTPFILVIDQTPRDALLAQAFCEDLELAGKLADRIGARAVLCFADTINIPANDVPVDEDGHPLKFLIQPDFTEFRTQVEAELRTTRERLTEQIRAQVDAELRHAENTVYRRKPPGAIPKPRPSRDGGEHSYPDAPTEQP